MDESLAAQFPDLGGALFGARGKAVSEEDVGALLRETQSRSPSDSAGAPGDQRIFTL